MSPRIHYLAYGSNLHPVRLRARTSSARLVGVARLAGRRVVFHKRGKDGSAKCDLVEDATCDAFAALYELDVADKAVLDLWEGRGVGYRDAVVEVEIDGRRYVPFVYLAMPSHVDPSLRPFDWYRALVVAGARHHGFPACVVHELESVEAIHDPDAGRAERGWALVRIADRTSTT